MNIRKIQKRRTIKERQLQLDTERITRKDLPEFHNEERRASFTRSGSSVYSLPHSNDSLKEDYNQMATYRQQKDNLMNKANQEASLLYASWANRKDRKTQKYLDRMDYQKTLRNKLKQKQLFSTMGDFGDNKEIYAGRASVDADKLQSSTVSTNSDWESYNKKIP
eukprot:UN12427